MEWAMLGVSQRDFFVTYAIRKTIKIRVIAQRIAKLSIERRILLIEMMIHEDNVSFYTPLLVDWRADEVGSPTWLRSPRENHVQLSPLFKVQDLHLIFFYVQLKNKAALLSKNTGGCSIVFMHLKIILCGMENCIFVLVQAALVILTIPAADWLDRLHHRVACEITRHSNTSIINSIFFPRTVEMTTGQD